VALPRLECRKLGGALVCPPCLLPTSKYVLGCVDEWVRWREREALLAGSTLSLDQARGGGSQPARFGGQRSATARGRERCSPIHLLERCASGISYARRLVPSYTTTHAALNPCRSELIRGKWHMDGGESCPHVLQRYSIHLAGHAGRSTHYLYAWLYST